MSYLKTLEAESIYILREVAASFDNPVMMFSIGKDSCVMLHLARKAFYPANISFPLLHIDTGWKFNEMINFRDYLQQKLGFKLIIYQNQQGVDSDINPFTHDSTVYTDIMKTQALKQALTAHQFDAVIGGARRDEEKSRAKERIFSFRNAEHVWDPKNQRPELWKHFNTRIKKGESIRVFPLSNWTESDIWEYIHLENIEIVPLYFAKERPVVQRNNMLIMVDDQRLPLLPNETPIYKKIRFRTLGCYPLTAAIESNAGTLVDIVEEIRLAKTSERQGRLIDKDQSGSMEKKKLEGYF